MTKAATSKKLPSDPAALRRLASTLGAERNRLLKLVDDGLSESERVLVLSTTFNLADVRIAQGDEESAEKLYMSAIQLGLMFVSPRYPAIEEQLLRLPAKINLESPLTEFLHKLPREDKIRIFEKLTPKQKSAAGKGLTVRDRRLLKLEAEPECEAEG